MLTSNQLKFNLRAHHNHQMLTVSLNKSTKRVLIILLEVANLFNLNMINNLKEKQSKLTMSNNYKCKMTPNSIQESMEK